MKKTPRINEEYNVNMKRPEPSFGWKQSNTNRWLCNVDIVGYLNLSTESFSEDKDNGKAVVFWSDVKLGLKDAKREFDELQQHCLKIEKELAELKQKLSQDVKGEPCNPVSVKEKNVITNLVKLTFSNIKISQVNIVHGVHTAYDTDEEPIDFIQITVYCNKHPYDEGKYEENLRKIRTTLRNNGITHFPIFSFRSHV